MLHCSAYGAARVTVAAGSSQPPREPGPSPDGEKSQLKNKAPQVITEGGTLMGIFKQL